MVNLFAQQTTEYICSAYLFSRFAQYSCAVYLLSMFAQYICSPTFLFFFFFFLTTRRAEQITPLDTRTVSISGNFATFFLAEQMLTKMLSKSFAQQCKDTEGFGKIGLILQTICSAMFWWSAYLLSKLLSIFAQFICSAYLFSTFAQYICTACLLSIFFTSLSPKQLIKCAEQSQAERLKKCWAKLSWECCLLSREAVRVLIFGN